MDAAKPQYRKVWRIMKTEVLIVGSGCSGLYCALQLPRDKQIIIITKADVPSSDSYLAQGGICMLKNDADYESYFEDTMKAGHYENDKESVDIMIRSSQDVIKDLLSYGVDFFDCVYPSRNGRHGHVYTNHYEGGCPKQRFLSGAGRNLHVEK